MRPATIRGGVLLVAALAGCSSPGIQDYAANQPVLDLAQYFTGKTHAWGMFQDRNGKVVKRFTVEITGTHRNNELVLDEQFTYSDGQHQQRQWHLTRQDNGHWRGRAADVVGEAQGETAGNALHWQYTLQLPVDQHVYNVQFDDWMFLIDRRSMLNRASMSKLGIHLGDITLYFHKEE